MPFILKTGLYSVLLVGVVSSVAIPLTMKGKGEKEFKVSENNSDSRGGLPLQISGYHSEDLLENKGQGNDDHLSKLVKIMIYLFKGDSLQASRGKIIQLKRESKDNSGFFSNLERDWTEERIKSNEVRDEDFERKMKDALKYATQQGEERQGTSIGHGGNGGTSGNNSNLSKNVVMVNVDPEGKKNVLLQAQLKDKNSHYVVGLYDADKGELTLGLSECSNPQSSQCQISKLKELQDRRIRLIFSSSN